MYQEQTERLYEQQNDDLVNELNGKVDILKSLAIDFRNEAKDQNKMLDDMEGDFDGTSTFLAGTMSRMEKMLNTGGSNHMCYLILFIFLVFMFIYFAIKYR